MVRDVGREIDDLIGQGIVLANLVTRRGEKRQQDLVLRELALDRLDDGTPLLELAQRGGMEPNPVAFGSGQRRAVMEPFPNGSDATIGLSTALDPLLRLGVAKPSGHPYAEGIQQDSYGEQYQH